MNFVNSVLAVPHTGLLLWSVFCGAFAGCSDASGGASSLVEVDVGPSICLLTANDGGLAPVQVSCTVAVGNTTESMEGIAVSVTNVMAVYALPEVCPKFGPGEQKSERFGAATAKALAAAYAKAGSGWTIDSVACR